MSADVVAREMTEALARIAASEGSEHDLKRTLDRCFAFYCGEYSRHFGYEAIKRVLTHAQRYANEITIRGQLVYELDQMMRDE